MNIVEIYEKITKEGCGICSGKGWVTYSDKDGLVKEECYCQVVEEQYFEWMGDQ
mgnify:CR=1 FL=1|tara:strand:- start:22 stop:183 length:162 start_codon:yes stop_codon:yes gene_type:complete